MLTSAATTDSCDVCHFQHILVDAKNSQLISPLNEGMIRWRRPSQLKDFAKKLG